MKPGENLWEAGTGQRRLLVFWLCSASLWLGLMSLYPWQVDSDDAMNFALAIERFSVLEFRPHFPGYPGMVAGGWLFHLMPGVETAERAVVAFTVFSAAVIPLAAGWWAGALSGSLFTAMTTVLVLFASPLLAGLALSGLSDAPALACLLWALAALALGRYSVAGWALALMLAIRPSYFVLGVGCLLFTGINQFSGMNGATLMSPNQRKLAFRQAALAMLWPQWWVGSVCLVFILSRDGVAYFEEGWRFTRGHFSLWGNTLPDAPPKMLAWWPQIAERLGLYTLVAVGVPLVGAFRQSESRWRLSVAVLGLYFLWMLCSQNPANLRHFAPVFCLAVVLLLVFLTQKVRSNWLVALAATGFLPDYSAYWRLPPGDAPVHVAIAAMSSQLALNPMTDSPRKAALGLNYSVHLVRQRLPDLALYDLYYPEHEILLGSEQYDLAWRLSTTPLTATGYRWERDFPARFPTEQTLYLYRVDRGGELPR